MTIADGRVNQRGMTIPVGDFTRIELAGWVDFDRNIALNATVPVTPAMLGNNPLLSDIAAGTKVRLPIRGTLDRPSIDQEAFASEPPGTGEVAPDPRGDPRGDGTPDADWTVPETPMRLRPAPRPYARNEGEAGEESDPPREIPHRRQPRL